MRDESDSPRPFTQTPSPNPAQPSREDCRTQELAKQPKEAGDAWLKLEYDGDSAVVVFLGEPHPRDVAFIDNKFVPFTRRLKVEGHKPVLRFTHNVALFETREVKVLEYGIASFKEVLRMRHAFGLETWAVEVQRHGAAKDWWQTRYSLQPERRLSPEQQQAFQRLPLHDLAKLRVDASTQAEAARRGEAGARRPNARLVQYLSDVLKTMPRKRVERLLHHYLGMQQVGDVSAMRGEEWQTFVEEVAVEYQAFWERNC
ncbi:hypothetical protein [Myxococcus sp. AM010]|uniref:hypothetical protein n=1 Tax=Myxococcus sp. AM010 TaxID=2745138 RepID=UPI0020D1469B|nr:hypothetical protein [Myxococcus sp. AM010]